jgi:protein tyrosine/serine phosphatase
MRKDRISPWHRLPRIILAAVLVACLGTGGYYVYVRYVTANFHCVEPGEVYRSAQPSPGQLAKWIQRYGLKTILNLRGESSRDLVSEKAVADQYGVALINVGLPNHKPPEASQLMHLAEAIEAAQRPFLLHCLAGADRSGLASVMARMAIGGMPYDRSREQMDIKYLHVDTPADHVADVLDEYEEYCRAQGTGTGGWPEFRYWVFHVYKAS